MRHWAVPACARDLAAVDGSPFDVRPGRAEQVGLDLRDAAYANPFPIGLLVRAASLQLHNAGLLQECSTVDDDALSADVCCVVAE